MIVIYLLLAFLAAVCIGGICYIVYRLEELDEIKEELDKYSVHLDERANMLAQWESQLNKIQKNETDISSKEKNYRMEKMDR